MSEGVSTVKPWRRWRWTPRGRRPPGCSLGIVSGVRVRPGSLRRCAIWLPATGWMRAS
ncbi:hypothetical protein SAMN02745244_00868 [Tessaracoccus bendigoensis DSM 12906]|uniref:Uncharacterized protein n=1 Tax=Tessaracoccus bendigoensis DSM 12906 TaxID=1123357 RepID=A0A1M6DAJ2_9ACTN|nr:hypothetical protein SAMN02745244_00868 [Tessaracoccus bendigoensis DSM 12906]